MKTLRLSRLSIVDHLTGLCNRRYFEQCLKQFVRVAKKEKHHFSLMMMDIDKFKDVNDKYGHLVGDKVLKELAGVIKALMRRVDICFRYGGDEMMVILPNAGKEDAERAAERLMNRLGKHKFFLKCGDELSLKLSIGSSVFPEDGSKPKELIKKADELLYAAKRQKSNSKSRIAGPLIMETKLMLPGLKENVIIRPFLLSSLKENLTKKSILITADAGYGKTTLLTQLIKDEKFPCVYYDLDKNDGDFVVFVSYLIHGLEKIQLDLTTRTKGLLAQGGEAASNYELMMGTLINELVEKRKQELFIVLDDYHNLAEDSSVHKALDYFIDHLPDIVHVVIASRTIPPFAWLAKWRSKQDLFELSREGLKFTEEEVKALLTEVYKIVLSDEELRRVSEKTEGWITGIQLLLQSVRKGKTIGEILNGYLESNQPLFEYFVNEILKYEPAEVQNFLIESSVLDVITHEVCDGILMRKGSEELLKDLKKRNLFVSVVRKGEYKYHRLFREFLQGQIKDEVFRKALHLKAADYYQRKGELEQAIEHHLEAGSYEWAGKAIVRVVDGMEVQGRFPTLRGWMERIPAEVVFKSSRLVLLQGALYREQGRWEEVFHLYDQAERQFRDAGNPTDVADIHVVRGGLLWAKGDYRGALRDLRRALTLCSPSKVTMKAAILNTMGLVFRGLGDLKKARFFLRKADRLCSISGDHFTTISVSYNLGALAAYQGELQEAYVQYQKLLERVGNVYQHKVGMIFGNAAITALDMNRAAQAEQMLEHGQALCQAYEDPGSRIVLARAEGYLHLHRGQLDMAEARFHNVLEASRKLHWGVVESLALLDIARLHRYQGRRLEAERSLTLAEQEEGRLDHSLRPDVLIEKGLLNVMSGQFADAYAALKESLSLAENLGMMTRVFLAKLALAEANYVHGCKKGAHQEFNRAVQLAKLKDYDGLLFRELRYRPKLVELAQQAAGERSTLKAYLSGLVNQSNGPSEENRAAPSLKVALFGQFELAEEGRVKTYHLGRKTTKAILAFFLLHPQRAFTWETIASWAWPESSEKAAHKAFKNALWEIRRLCPGLKNAVLYQNGQYCMNPDALIWVDALAFKKFLEQALKPEEDNKTGLLERAVSLYRGSLLQEFFYPWVDDLRNILEAQYSKALHILSEKHFQSKTYESSVTYCLKCLEVDELDEKAQHLLITNYLQLSQRSKALKQYKHFQRLLRKHLKSEPSPATIALFESLP